MPIYEYKCQKCGKKFEAFQGITDPELKSCKFCKGKVHKMVSLSSFSLKGSGWYVTDYKGKKPGAAARKEKSKTSESSSTTETAKADSTKSSGNDA